MSTEHSVCETTFFVRYAETDTMGVVHHSNYLVYCEEARSQFSRERGATYADFEKDGYFLVVSEVNLRYLTPAVYGQKITIRVWVENMKTRKITFAYEVFNPTNGDIHVTGTTKHICVNRDGQVTRIPEHWIRQWNS